MTLPSSAGVKNPARVVNWTRDGRGANCATRATLAAGHPSPHSVTTSAQEAQIGKTPFVCTPVKNAATVVSCTTFGSAGSCPTAAMSTADQPRPAMMTRSAQLGEISIAAPAWTEVKNAATVVSCTIDGRCGSPAAAAMSAADQPRPVIVTRSAQFGEICMAALVCTPVKNPETVVSCATDGRGAMAAARAMSPAGQASAASAVRSAQPAHIATVACACTAVNLPMIATISW